MSKSDRVFPISLLQELNGFGQIIFRIFACYNMISSFLQIKIIISCTYFKKFHFEYMPKCSSTIQICRFYHNTNSSLDRKRIDPIQKLLFEKKYSLYILHQTCFSILSNVSSTTSYLLVVVKKISEFFSSSKLKLKSSIMTDLEL